jgi:hypothetical protein
MFPGTHCQVNRTNQIFLGPSTDHTLHMTSPLLYRCHILPISEVAQSSCLSVAPPLCRRKAVVLRTNALDLHIEMATRISRNFFFKAWFILQHTVLKFYIPPKSLFSQNLYLYPCHTKGNQIWGLKKRHPIPGGQTVTQWHPWFLSRPRWWSREPCRNAEDKRFL